MKNLSELQAGDSVALLLKRNGTTTRVDKSTVSRATKTQIIVGELRFQRDGGRQIGDGGWVVAVWDEKYAELMAAIKVERETAKKAEFLNQFDFRTLSAEQLNVVMAIVGGVS